MAQYQKTFLKISQNNPLSAQDFDLLVVNHNVFLLLASTMIRASNTTISLNLCSSFYYQCMFLHNHGTADEAQVWNNHYGIPLHQ